MGEHVPPVTIGPERIGLGRTSGPNSIGPGKIGRKRLGGPSRKGPSPTGEGKSGIGGRSFGRDPCMLPKGHGVFGRVPNVEKDGDPFTKGSPNNKPGNNSFF